MKVVASISFAALGAAAVVFLVCAGAAVGGCGNNFDDLFVNSPDADPAADDASTIGTGTDSGSSSSGSVDSSTRDVALVSDGGDAGVDAPFCTPTPPCLPPATTSNNNTTTNTCTGCGCQCLALQCNGGDDDCNSTCSNGSICEINCDADNNCRMTSQGATKATLKCSGGTNCLATCELGGSCVVDCNNNSGDDCIVDCKVGTSCVINCRSKQLGNKCKVQCPGGAAPKDCSNGIVTCNPVCPPP